MLELSQNQLDAISEMHNGCILKANTGVGKTRTAIAYYYTKVCGGHICVNGEGSFGGMTTPRDLFIITTAKNRDDYSWFKELSHFQITEDFTSNPSNIKVTVDSWQNIKKYRNVYGAFFVLDEQRLTGTGVWVKSFYKIAQKNQWIMLTATPGDKWEDYIPVFIANGFLKNKTEFYNKHTICNPYNTKYRQVEKYIGLKHLYHYKAQLLVEMLDVREAVEHHINIICDYNRILYKTVRRDRWNPFDNEPIPDIASLCYLERRIANTDPDRIVKLVQILEKTLKSIIFYNFNYELDIIREVCDSMCIRYAEWNGHKHEAIPEEGNLGWVYIVQYQAGAEAWNCITCDTIIFYSQNYSYKVMAQATGRINRRNTPFKDLYYYHLRSMAPIDKAIKQALLAKKDFNEKKYTGER